MRQFTTGNSYELSTSGGSKSIAIVPSAAQELGTFNVSGIDARIGNNRNYVTGLTPHLLTTFDPDAAGNAVSWDKLYKGLASAQLTAPALGTVFPHEHTSGAVLGHIIGFMANGYLYPQGARTQIPASTDVDVTLDLFYNMPFKHDFLADPFETCQPATFLAGGVLELKVGVSTVYDGDYAGAVIKAPTTLRCTLSTMASPREFIGVPFQWRIRQVAGGGSSPLLKGVGSETSLNSIQAGAGLVALLWLSDATGIGLGGPDGVDNFTQVGMTWRGQKATMNLDPYFVEARALNSRPVTHVSGVGSSPPNDNAYWPASMDSAGNNRPSANSQQYVLPLIVPGQEIDTSKVQRVNQDLQVDFGVTTPITNPHQFVTCELLEFSDSAVTELITLGGFQGTPTHRAHTAGAHDDDKLRYTAIEFPSN